MERGVYFDGWFPHHYCYHPSMAPRRLTMLEDLKEMGATMLVWAGLGGGSISLPYLEEEAHGEIPQRFRQYGFVNDGEFIAHAKAKDVDLFAIVFESQAWEFPAEVIDGKVVAQNELRGITEATTIGLREFSQDRGPSSWKSFRSYFPDGLINSDGEQVSDLWEEVASRDLEGMPLHAHWVEVADHGQNCYYADRNNPVWREYLKAIIRIQIDAGAPGIQLDETETPLSAIRYGGCFCKDCMKEFRRYLQDLDPADVPDELDGVDLGTFDYRGWLIGKGVRPRTAPQALPLYRYYLRSQQRSAARTFQEIALYAKEYAAQSGKRVRVAGNFYDCAPYYDPMVDYVDVLVTEMRETRYQQPWYFRHGVGMARGRSLVAVENPYGGVTAELLDKLQHGRARDLFRLTIFEASAMGANMSLPYGSWLGTEVKDSYWAPHDLVAATGKFLEEIDHLISPQSPHRTAVVYSVRSLMNATLDSDQFSDDGRWYEPVELHDIPEASYWETIEHLSRSSRTYDVIVFPDEDLRANDITADLLRRYSTIVVPSAWGVSTAQHRELVSFAQSGGRVIVHGAYGSELAPGRARELLDLPNVDVVERVDQIAPLTDDDVLADLGPLAAISAHTVADGLALHVVNYDYDEAADQVRTRRDVRVGIRSEAVFSRAVVHAPGTSVEEVPVRLHDGAWTVAIPKLDTYAVVHLS